MLHLRWWEGLLAADGRLYDDSHGWWGVGVDLSCLWHKWWDGTSWLSVRGQVIRIRIGWQYGSELGAAHLRYCKGVNRMCTCLEFRHSWTLANTTKVWGYSILGQMWLLPQPKICVRRVIGWSHHVWRVLRRGWKHVRKQGITHWLSLHRGEYQL